MKQTDRPSTPRRLADLERAQGELRRRVGLLADILAAGNNAPSQLTKWVGHAVFLRLVGVQNLTVGRLEWFDRYSYGISFDGGSPVIFNKGNVISIGLSEKEEGRGDPQ